jgi:V8-like Glu-specific endopeptidase
MKNLNCFRHVLILLISITLSNVFVFSQVQDYTVGNLMNYSQPKDSNYFSNIWVHHDLINSKIDSIAIDTSNQRTEFKGEPYVPTYLNTDCDNLQERSFGLLAAAYNYPNWPYYPYSAIVRLEMYNSNNILLGTCSGAFINKNTVLSAAHCVHSPPTTLNQIASIKVVPAYDNGSGPYGTYWATGWSVPQNWVTNVDWNYDFLVINLSGNPGLVTGYLGWWPGDANTDIFLNDLSLFNTLGYPATTLSGTPVFDYGERMWHMQGNFDYFGNGPLLGWNVVYHNNQGYKGLSGSNTYLKDGDNRYVMAILSHGFDPPSMPNSITGHVRINTFLGNFLYNYAPEVGVEEINSSSFSIYPNPANEKIYINGLNREKTSYSLLDLSGKVVRQSQTSGAIQTDDVEPGIYFLRIGEHTRKFIVVH